MDSDEQIAINIGRSARSDYRSYNDNSVNEIEQAYNVAYTVKIYLIINNLSLKGNMISLCKSLKGNHRNKITSTEQQLERWK